MIRFKYRDQYDDEADAIARAESDVTPTGKTLTQQSFKDDADINVIMKRFGITDGAVPVPQPAEFYDRPTSDFGEGVSLREVLDVQRAAANHFNALPAQIRKKFDNKPQKMHDWIHDEANHEEAVRLGLLIKKPTPEPTPAPAPTQ